MQVIADLPDYEGRIQQPPRLMDLTRINARLRARGGEPYTEPYEFWQDMTLMFQNSISYWESEKEDMETRDYVLTCVPQMRDIFERRSSRRSRLRRMSFEPSSNNDKMAVRGKEEKASTRKEPLR